MSDWPKLTVLLRALWSRLAQQSGFYYLPSPDTFNSSAVKECSGHPGFYLQFTQTDRFYFIVLFYCYTCFIHYLCTSCIVLTCLVPYL